MSIHHQTTSEILLVRPANFSFNEQTALSNAFQNKAAGGDQKKLRQQAFDEFDLFAEKLRSNGIGVTVFDDTTSPPKPDSVFPNNWISFHDDGTVILYPMYAPNRRLERRMDIIDELKKIFSITSMVDLSFYEKENRFLEGTGSVVFDHPHKLAYACISPRTDKELFLTLCKKLDYTAIPFHAHDRNGIEIYHTNVLMCVCENFSVICLNAITSSDEREKVIKSLSQTGHEIIDISFEQMNRFAGNMLALKNKENKKLLVLSQSAFDSLLDHQKTTILTYCEMIPLNIKTIETIGGGSARCMIAEIFLPKK
ncbi:MAG: arginine deiminase-related protein [Ginsengibacter sp.]